MSVTTPQPHISHAREHGTRMTRRSLLMLPLFVVAFFATSVVGEYVVLDLLGLPEGSLFLMQEGTAGWVTEIVFVLLLVAAPAAGVWFAVQALRDQGRWPAWIGLVTNALLVLVVAYMFIDHIRMSFFAPLD